MENVIVATICIALIFFAVLSISNTTLSSADDLFETWAEMRDRLQDDETTYIDISSIDAVGNYLLLYVENKGALAFEDFDKWDMILEWEKNKVHTFLGWVPYTSSNPPANGYWTVHEIQFEGNPETMELGILNPGETALLRVGLKPNPKSDVRALVATGNGISALYTWES